MEGMVASGSRLCQIIQGAGLRPRTAQRFQTVLATAGVVALTDAGVTSHMDDMMVNSIRKFTAVKKRVAKAPTSPSSHHAHARGRDEASLTYYSCLCVYDRWAQQVFAHLSCSQRQVQLRHRSSVREGEGVVVIKFLGLVRVDATHQSTALDISLFTHFKWTTTYGCM